MLLSVAGAPADARALQRFRQAYDAENQPHRWGFLLGAASLSSGAAAAFDRVLAVRALARRLEPLLAEGWLVLPSIRFEGEAEGELDFFLLAPSGGAYAVLAQRYTKARLKASGTELYGNGYRDSLPQAVQDRAQRIAWHLRERGVHVRSVTPAAALVDVEALRYWGPNSVLVAQEWKLIAHLRRREQQATGWHPVQDARLLTPQFWNERADFSDVDYQLDRRLHRQVALRLLRAKIFGRAWLILLAGVGAGVLAWIYLTLAANQQAQLLIMR